MLKIRRSSLYVVSESDSAGFLFYEIPNIDINNITFLQFRQYFNHSMKSNNRLMFSTAGAMSL